jgi:hypothetical protein
VETVALKTPTAAYVPLFWVFPLNMLTWFADDWIETAWTFDITIETNNLDMADRETRSAEDWLQRYWEGKVLEGKIELDRFKTVKLKPGVIRLIRLLHLCLAQRSPQLYLKNPFLFAKARLVKTFTMLPNTTNAD